MNHLWYPYSQMAAAVAPLQVASAQGLYLTLADGHKLMDGISSWWVMCHGHNHQRIVAAIEQQSHKFLHVMAAGLTHRGAENLAEQLAHLLPGQLRHIFFSESGSVAVEISLKMARQYWKNLGKPRRQILAFDGAYHGDTHMAMAVSDAKLGFHHSFADALPSVLRAPIPDTDEHRHWLQKLVATHHDDIAAVIIEPLIQGAGGMRFYHAQTLDFIHQVCARAGIIIIHDEIMTGFGRTGTLFASQSCARAPDIICLGKALSAGALPFAATVASEQVFAAFLGNDNSSAFMHGPTFMSHALGCAAALASLEIFSSEPVLMRVSAIEAQMKEGLSACANIKGVVQVRVKGAVGVVELSSPIIITQETLLRRGVWLRPFGNIIYLMPPFITTANEMKYLCRTVVELVTEWSANEKNQHERNSHAHMV